MARVASLEVVVVGILAALLFLGVSAAAVADVGHPVAWLTFAVALVVLAIVTSLFDYARVAVVANDDGSALGALRDGIELLGRSPMSVVVLALLNGAVGLVVFLLAVWVHSVAPLDTGAGVLVGLLVGQAGLAARLWSRVAAYAAETSLWERARAV
jgi:hypothetical protein